jgi:poly-beta-hydroxyalkanoate depolymerase
VAAAGLYTLPPLVETVSVGAGILKVGVAAAGWDLSDANAIAEVLGVVAGVIGVCQPNPPHAAAGTLGFTAFAHIPVSPLGSTLFSGSLPT